MSSPYLRHRSRSSWRRWRTSASRVRVLLDRLGDAAHLADDVVELDEHGGGPIAGVPIGRPAADRGDRRGERVACSTVVGEDRVGLGTRLAVADGVGEGVLVGLEGALLVRVGEVGGGDLVDLEAEQVDLAGALPLVPAERRQLGVELGEAGACCLQRPQVDRAEAVEGLPLGGDAEQGLVGVLAVQVDDGGGHLGERGRGGRATVDVGA